MFEIFTSFTGFLRANMGIYIDFNKPYQKSIIDPLYSSIVAVHFVLGLILWLLKNLICSGCESSQNKPGTKIFDYIYSIWLQLQ